MKKLILAAFDRWPLFFDPLVAQHYRKRTRAGFELTRCKAIAVKKGRRRYDVIIIELPGGAIRVNIGKAGARL